ncbi:MAG: 3-hydroxyacyl-CoA dehydrogenase family protein [Promethearchaeota archaeon]
MGNDIKIVAVIGAGFLGKQIASQTAFYDYTVRIYDVRTDMLELLVKKIKRKKKKRRALGEVTYHYDLAEAVKDADLIIEAVPEKLELKKKIFSQIDKAAPLHAIIATNSSSIPVSRLEEFVQRKDKLLNIHFYHQAIPMVDLMKGTKTSDETFETGKKWIESIEFTPIIVKKESFGFVFNRLWHRLRLEALKMWAEGYADIEMIDTAWKIFTHMDLGPFGLMDTIGLDTVYNVHMSYYNETSDPKEKPPQALKDMIDRGELGAKTKKGFYTY